MKALEVTNYIEKLAPINSGIMNDENGFIFGDKNKIVKKVGVAWMPTLEVLKNVEKEGIDLLIIHEHLFYTTQDSEWYQDIETNNKEINKLKIKILQNKDLVVYRAHSNWDCLKKFGIIDSLAEEIGLKKIVNEEKYIKTYEINETSLLELSEILKEKLNTKNISFFGDPRSKILRVTLLIGGFGGNQYNIPEVAKKHNSDLIIYGDLIEHVLIHTRELGLKVIRIGHSISEIPGIKKMYNLLKKEFPDLSFTFFESGIN
jgi:dinuclear metal center YbgI/SA1388 family protein